MDTNWAGWARIALLNHALGNTAGARDEATAFLTLARSWDTPAAIGQALATNGLIEGGRSGLALLAESVEHLERSPARLLLHTTSSTTAPHFVGAGERGQARERLRRGLDIAAAQRR